jgi:transketolase
MTKIADGGRFNVDDRSGRNVYFGVREHAMGAVLNGMALHGGVRPYGGTFLIFSDYMRPSIRLAAIMGQNPIYLFSHDSIGLGEDGPTHQPIETLTALRAIPNMRVIRPADANDTVQAWREAIKRQDGPTAIVLTRHGVPVFDRSTLGSALGLVSGGYVLAEASGGKPDVVLMASGSEVSIVMEAKELLEKDGTATRVVNMACLEMFAAQDQKYRDSVLPPDVPRLAVEAAHPMSWYRWIGDRGDVMGIERFGESAPWKDLYAHFGFTPGNVMERAKQLLRE